LLYKSWGQLNALPCTEYTEKNMAKDGNTVKIWRYLKSFQHFTLAEVVVRVGTRYDALAPTPLASFIDGSPMGFRSIIRVHYSKLP